jgi:acyl-[acyl carrier protein]--UDP-N-acetylglucosamine O-acyltransferase
MSHERGSIHPTSVVSADANLGPRVTVGPFCTINANVSIGEGSFVDSHTILGASTADFYDDPGAYNPPECRIGAGAVVRSHSIVYAGASLGDGVSTGHRVTIREGSDLGEGVRVGTLCDLQGELMIGPYARLHSNVFVPQRTTIEEFVWLFPHVVLANDPHPPSDTCTIGPTIRRFAVVGAGAMVFPGVEIGEGAVIGAMTLVRHDVAPQAVVVGVPGQVRGTAADIECRDGRLERVYPWWTHFRRGYPEDVLPPRDAGSGESAD